MTESNPGCVCFGMTLHNKAGYLDSAVKSLLDQTHSDFKLIAVDDASADDTEAIMRRWAANDSRVHYFRNSTWKGMIETWRIAFFKTMELYKPRFFAWASDHDVWQPDWLKRHLETMIDCPDASLVYPETIPIDPDGEPISKPSVAPFDTYDEDEMGHLYKVSSRLGSAGYAVYGLFRTAHLLKAGVFRRVMLPDRLLVTEISAFGRIKQINEKLWCRRFFGTDMNKEEALKRQQNILFGPDGPPPQSDFPFLSHVASLLGNLCIVPPDGDRSCFAKGLALSGLVWERRRNHIRNELNRLHMELSANYVTDSDADRKDSCNSQAIFHLATCLNHELSARSDIGGMAAAVLASQPELVNRTLLGLRVSEAEQMIKRLENTISSLKEENKAFGARLISEKRKKIDLKDKLRQVRAQLQEESALKETYKKEAELSVGQRLTRKIRKRLAIHARTNSVQ